VSPMIGQSDVDTRLPQPHAPGMRAGVEPERIVAGTLLLLVAAGVAIIGSAVILGALLSSSAVHAPPPLAAGIAMVGFAALLTWLSVVVLAGRHPQRALAMAAVLVAAFAVIVRLAAIREPVGILQQPYTIPLLGVAFASVVALLIGRRRLTQR
jgi:hypothetical protein